MLGKGRDQVVDEEDLDEVGGVDEVGEGGVVEK
jgi:hypothetical protein